MSGHVDVCVVTVTYGRRWSLLSQVLEACAGEGVGRIVVVDNGALEPVAERVAARFGDLVDVVVVGENRGSAHGFRRGLERALALGHDFVWVLDDDNLPMAGCLDRLRGAWRYLGDDRANALACFRPQWPAPAKLLRAGLDTYALPGAFMGFRLLDAPEKIARRVFRRVPARQDIRFALARIPHTSYGGLFLHRELLARIGLPDESLFMYVDDAFFTARITEAGGSIHLCAGAVVDDITPSWHLDGDGWRGHAFFNPAANIARIYFSARNILLWERRYPRGLRYWGNGLAFFGLGMLVSLLAGASPGLCWSRLRLVWKALRAAQQEDFSLPPEVQAAWSRLRDDNGPQAQA